MIYNCRKVSLEKAAEEVSNNSSVPPLIFQLPPEQGREVLNQAQDSPVSIYPAYIFVIPVNTGAWGVC